MSIIRLVLAFALLTFPAVAGQLRQSFRVGAVVARSAMIRSELSSQGTSRLSLAGAPAVSLQIDSGPARLVRGAEIALPEGATTVTVQY